MQAVFHGHYRVVEYLLSAGAYFSIGVNKCNYVCITKCCKVLLSVTQCYYVSRSVIEYYRCN